MEKRSGNAINVPKNTLFNLIGKLTVRFVVLESTNVIVELCFPGIQKNLKIRFVFYFLFFLNNFVGLIVNFVLFLCRRDSFITHRAFCDALAVESARAQTQPQHQNQKQNQAVANPSSESDPKVQAAESPSPLAPAPAPVSAPAPAPVQVSAPAAPALPQSTSVISSSVLPIQSSGKFYILPSLEIFNLLSFKFVRSGFV